MTRQSQALSMELGFALGELRWVKGWAGERWAVRKDDSEYAQWADVAPGSLTPDPDCLGNFPDYADDLNDCRLAELRLIELGLGEMYRQTLENSIQADLWAVRGSEGGWALAALTAPAQIRCQAMITVLKGQE